MQSTTVHFSRRSGSDQIVAGVSADLAKKKIQLSNLKLGLTTVDFTPLISQALAKQPDCVAFNGDGSQTVKIVTSMRKQGSPASSSKVWPTWARNIYRSWVLRATAYSFLHPPFSPTIRIR